MTEEEWLTEHARPKWMLAHLLDEGKVQRTKAGKRRLRLFACGVCRRLWHLLDDRLHRPALEVAERYADGEEDSREGSRKRSGRPLPCDV